MNRPNLIIAGPPKAGTTSVFEWLASHPQACPSKKKETFYFSENISGVNRSENYLSHGLSRYSEVFEACKNASVFFEATPNYIFDSVAREQIPKLGNDLKVMFIYRDPAERLWSEYRFKRYKKRTFSGSFEDFIGLQGNQCHGHFFERGKILDLINDWSDKMGKSQVWVFHFDDLKKHPRAFMQKMSSLLGIDDTFYKDFVFEKKNETYALRTPKLHRAALKIRKALPDGVKNLLLPLYWKINRTSVPPATPREMEVLALLREAYNDQQFDRIRATCWRIKD